MGFLETVKNTAVTKTSRASLVLKKNSPEIFLTIGIVGFVGTVVLACRATLKADEILDHHAKKIKDIEDAKDVADQNQEEYEYDEDLYKKDRLVQSCKTGVGIAKVYAPAIALGSISLACILVSRNIMQKRYLGAVAAYNALSAAFNEYRERVRSEAGDIMDRHYRYGTKLDEITVETVDENGKKHKEKQLVEVEDSVKCPAAGAIWFDESNPNWDTNPNFNMTFLRGIQARLNNMLHTKGVVFLNEVYDALGIPPTQEGAVLGWIMGLGDDEIDFGLYREDNQARKFVNGVANRILLDFNHDGVILNKI